MNDIAKHYDDYIWSEPDEDIWVTGKGKAIKVKNMTNTHIINTIRAWEGLGKTTPPKGYMGGKKKWLDILTRELKKRK